MSFLPEHRFGSQCPRSQHAALKEGREARGCEASSSESAPRGPRLLRGGLLYFLPREEKLSFLWRTMMDGFFCCGFFEGK
jgi:hypothetical protein